MVIYKCPGCGGNMVFDSKTQKLFCEYCQTTKTMDEMEAAKDRTQSQSEPERSEEETGFRMYQCPSCGAEILTDEFTVATFCSFCQSATLVKDDLSGEKAPTRLIAFQKNKEEAKQAYLKWAKRGLLTPRDFVKTSTVEKITGMYVPFWIYDYDTDTKLHVEATKVRTERKGDMEYTHTDYFDVYREVTACFSKIPTDASQKMDDVIMDMLEPFHYNDLTKFQMPYLSGFYAERYNYTSEQLQKRVERRVHNYAHQGAMDTIYGYATKQVRKEQLDMKKQKEEYVLFPVWMLNYRYQGKNYFFTMNGQTGKVVADLPVSKGKMLGWFAGITGVSFFIMTIISLFL